MCKLLESSLMTIACAVSHLHILVHVGTPVCRRHSGNALCRSCTHPCTSTPHLRSIMYLATWSMTTAASQTRLSVRQRKKHAGALAQGTFKLQLPECGTLLLRRACYLCATVSTHLLQVVSYVRLRSDCNAALRPRIQTCKKCMQAPTTPAWVSRHRTGSCACSSGQLALRRIREAHAWHWCKAVGPDGIRSWPRPGQAAARHRRSGAARGTSQADGPGYGRVMCDGESASCKACLSLLICDCHEKDFP